MSMETIIRPWQTNSVAPSQQYFVSGQQAQTPVVIRAGRSGQGKTMNGTVSYNATFYCTAYANEKRNSEFGVSSL